ncbi:MAG: hypothetical protein ACP6IU_02495 [Candidatus Asgardarchaeia archaeon]
MKLIESLVALMHLVDKKIRPDRIIIQEILYFLKFKGLINTTYFPHYYGPYSIDVHDTIVRAVLFDFLREDTLITDENKIQYEYELTQDGKRFANEIIKHDLTEINKLKWIINICESYSGLNRQKLANAAKIYFVLSTGDLKKEKLGNYNAVKEAIMLYGWCISDEGISEAKRLLSKLGLI